MLVVVRTATGYSAVGSASGLGPESRQFKSVYPDHFDSAPPSVANGCLPPFRPATEGFSFILSSLYTSFIALAPTTSIVLVSTNLNKKRSDNMQVKTVDGAMV